MEVAVLNVREQVLSDLPNDLIRLIYLASLRDCNTGYYSHPQISRQSDGASETLRFCHEDDFEHLMATSLSDYAQQLSAYIVYTQAEKGQVLDMWTSLPAYRTAVPRRVSALEAEFFFTSIETALNVLATTRLVSS